MSIQQSEAIENRLIKIVQSQRALTVPGITQESLETKGPAQEVPMRT